MELTATMKTKAIRLYGVNDLRLEEFELPPITENEILAHIISDSVCMSTHKAASLGAAHKRVPNDVAEHPVIVGHEFCGEILQVGANWQSQFHAGDRFSIQPALNYHGTLDAPGYSYPYIGGSATYVVIPGEVMEMNCLLPYRGDAFFYGSLAEPMSCIVGGFHANYHVKQGTYVHHMGIRAGGTAAILAGAGPMGLGAIDYAIHAPVKPSLLVVTDIDDARLQRAAEILTVEEAEKNGVKLIYRNTAHDDNPASALKALSPDGFDDVFVFAPVESVVQTADAILSKDGCLNFFAGPTRADFSAKFNFYNVHYMGTHVVGTSGGNTDDMREALEMMQQGQINPAAMITHIGGLDATIDTVLRLPQIPGGKKLIYTNISMPLTALSELGERGKSDPLCAALHDIVTKNNGLWCTQAEQYLLSHATPI